MTTMPEEVVLPIKTDGDVIAARQAGRELATRLGFSSTDLTLVATAISEVGRNIINFAREGEITIGVVEEGSRKGVRVIARDTGPGIADISLAMQDGYSTAGSLGVGLPGARRLMDEFEIESEIGTGTTVTMTKWAEDSGTTAII